MQPTDRSRNRSLNFADSIDFMALIAKSAFLEQLLKYCIIPLLMLEFVLVSGFFKSL